MAAPPHPSRFAFMNFCLFCVFHTNGTTQHVVFCDLFVSLNILRSRFSHTVACASTSLLYG